MGYPSLQNNLSPYPNTSGEIFQAVHHIPLLVTLYSAPTIMQI